MDSTPHLKLLLNNSRILYGDLIGIDEDVIHLDNAFFDDEPTFSFSIKFEVSFIENMDFDNEIGGEYDEVQSDLRKKEEKEYEGASLELGAVPEGYDQIKENEKRFGIQLKYDESDYTSTIDKEGAFWRENYESARKIEKEILTKRKEKNEDEGKYSDVLKRKTKAVNGRGLKKDEGMAVGKSNPEKELVKNKENKTLLPPRKREEQNKERLPLKPEQKRESAEPEDPKSLNRTRQPYRARQPTEQKVVKPESNDTESNLNKEQKVIPAVQSPSFSWSNVNLTKNTSQASKRITYGKPNRRRFASLSEMISQITGNFSGSRDMKIKWSTGPECFLSYKEEPKGLEHRK